ncbi:MAG: RING finger protein [Pirellulaceae bacterium]|nr:RING finger protein [Pirellulaceae bacterium]
MECLGILILLTAIVAAVGVIAVGSLQARLARWNESFGIVAARFQGHFSPGGWFAQPVVRLQYGAAEARLTCFAIAGPPQRKCVQMVLQQRDQRLRCDLLSWPAAQRLANDSAGLAPIELDWSGQAERWRVLADDGDEARRIFSRGVRLALDRLWLAPLPSDTLVSLMPGWIVVRKVWENPRGADLEQFVESVCTLSDQLQIAAASGIEFVEGDEAQLLDEATCGVCCEKLAGEIVFCGRCKTPAHRECWAYTGGCATYGCGGQVCHAPRPAPPTPHYTLGPAPAARPKPR